MSRWITQFEEHQFQASWRKLKSSLEAAKIDDETVVTSVQELGRLNKVVAYIDEAIQGIDPELTPASIWDNFLSQANSCRQQIDNYNSNRNISHISQANQNADNLLTYVRPYMIKEGKVARALQSSIKAYSKVVTEQIERLKQDTSECISEIKDNLQSSKSLLHESTGAKESIVDYKKALLEGTKEKESIKVKVIQLVDSINEKHEKITNAYEEILVSHDDEDSIRAKIMEAKSEIIEEQNLINDIYINIKKKEETIEGFHKRVFGEEIDLQDVNSEDNSEQPIKKSGSTKESQREEAESHSTISISERLKSLIRKMDSFEEKQRKKYCALVEEIEGLLPGSTSAGLATAHKEMKDSFDKPIRNSSLLFHLSIFLLVSLSLVFAIESISFDGIKFIDVTEWESVLKGLLNKLPFYIPLTWLAIFASKRRSEFQRLQQEYAHKESLAKSYHSYKKQIGELDDEDLSMQKVLMMKAVDAIAYNASKTLDGKHGDNTPIYDTLEKLKKKVFESESTTSPS